jgi:hypothetical protein
MIPADLLDKLREKDPELYENIAKSFAWAELQYDELYPEYVGDKPHLPDEIEIDNHMEHLIQGCLQEAIRARGWIFELNSKLCEGGLCSAWVFKNLKEWKKDQFDPTAEYINMGGDTEAEALLRAYLAAIHSE